MRTQSYVAPSVGKAAPSSAVIRPYGIRKVIAETINQNTAWAPYDDDWPIVSSATMAQTVKKIMSKRKSDFLSFRFSATSPATAADSPIGYPPLKSPRNPRLRL